MTRGQDISPSTIALLILLAAVWGSAFTMIKVLLDDLSPVEIAAGRLALGAVTVLLLLRIFGDLRWPAANLIAPIALLAILDTVVPYMLVGWAESRIDSGTASVLISAMPLFTVLFAVAALPDERLSGSRLAGIAIGFGGVVLLSGSPSISGGDARFGSLAVVGAAASYGAGVVLVRVLLRRIDAMSLTAFKLLGGALMTASLTIAARDGGGYAALDATDALLLIALGVVSTGLSFAAYIRIVERVGSIRASTVTYIIPVFGLVIGAIALGEPIRPATLAGMTLIVGGVATVMYAPSRESMTLRVRALRRLPKAA